MGDHMRKSVKLIVIGIFVFSALANILFAYQFNARDGETRVKPVSNEKYIYIAATNKSQQVEIEKEGLNAFRNQFHVNADILAPDEFDVVAQTQLLLDAIEQKPDGIIIYGAALSLTPYVNKAIDAGIPTITVGSDLPDSKRLAYVGPDWHEVGVKQAETVIELINESGTVAMLGRVGSDSTDQAFSGFEETMEKYEDVYVLEGFDDMGTIEEASRLTKKLVKEYDIKAIAGFDSNSVLGIAQALKELEMEKKIKVVGVDITPDNLKLVEEGIVEKLIGQKEELMTYYGFNLLYDINHSKLSITTDDPKNSVTNIPKKINTGLIEIDKLNVKDFLK